MRRKKRGQAILEAVIILPILVFLLLATVQVVVLLNTKVAVTSAAREAARAYAVYQDASRARDVAEQNLRDAVIGYTGQRPDVEVSSSGGYVRVTVTYSQPSLVPGLFRLMGVDEEFGAVPVTSAAVFRIEPR
ncbi:MAG: TadE family protein [Bacillota bacterium]